LNDADNSGFISKDEFFEGIDKLGHKLKVTEKDGLWNEVCMFGMKDVLTFRNLEDALKLYFDS